MHTVELVHEGLDDEEGIDFSEKSEEEVWGSPRMWKDAHFDNQVYYMDWDSNHPKEGNPVTPL
jgi:hypothetical protein